MQPTLAHRCRRVTNRENLGVGRRVPGCFTLVVTRRNDLPVHQHHRTHRHITCGCGRSRLLESTEHGCVDQPIGWFAVHRFDGNRGRRGWPEGDGCPWYGPAMHERRLFDGLGERVRALGAPWFVAAVVVLLTNDHLFKKAFPGPLTGKVSDFAGPVVLAGLVSVLCGRSLAVAFAATVLFALKVVPGVAELAAPLLGGVTSRDPSDLIGLMALAPTWFLLAPTEPDGTAEPHVAPPTSARGPIAATLRDRVLPIGGATVALMALTATSAGVTYEVHNLAAVGSTLYVEQGFERDNLPDDRRWARSDDGGLTWEPIENAPPVEASDQLTEACRSDGVCFAARGSRVDMRKPGGDWVETFSFTSDQQEVMRYYREGSSDPDFTALFRSVLVVDVPGGEHVVVNAFDEGLVVLPPDGGWKRVSVLDVEATPSNGAVWPLDLGILAWLFSAPVGLILVIARAVLMRKRKGPGTVMLLPILGAMLIGAVIWFIGGGVWMVGISTRQNPLVLGLVLLASAAVVLAIPVAFVAKLAHGPRPGSLDPQPPPPPPPPTGPVQSVGG